MKVVPKRRWRYPIALEREYDKRLTAFVEQNMKIIKQFVPDMAQLLFSYAAHVDAEGSGVAARLDILMDRIERAVHDANDFQRIIENIYGRVSAYNLAEWETITKSVLGAPLRDLPFRTIQQDDEADDTLRELWVEDNLSLIRSIDLQTRERIRNMLREKILGNVSHRELVKDLTDEIERIAGLERNRAALIGRDQVGKLNGQLTHYRQTNAGIEEYEWRSSHDSRVRPTHRQFDGHIYSWRGSPQAPEGPPSWPIRCRCVALPVIDLDKIVTKPGPGSYVLVDSKLDFMAHHRFKPSLAETESQIKFVTPNQKAIYFQTHLVRNSEFTLLAETSISPRDDILRTLEALLKKAAADVAGEVDMPTIVVIDLQEAFGLDSIGGFDSRSGKLFISSRYDTPEKILEYVRRFNEKDFVQFANQTELAPILHELGHKFYYGLIKEVAKTREIPYNKGKEIIDTLIQNWGNELALQDRTLKRALSKYADRGFQRQDYTEVIAEVFSVREENNYAKDLMSRLKGVLKNDDSTNRTRS